MCYYQIQLGELELRWTEPWTITELKGLTSITMKMGATEQYTFISYITGYSHVIEWFNCYSHIMIEWFN